MAPLSTLLIVLLVLAGAPAKAASGPAAAGSEDTGSDAPRVHAIPSRGTASASMPLARPLRVLVESGSGAAFGFAGGAALGLFGLVVACQNPNTADRLCLQGALIGASVGYLVGVPLGVYLVGNALGGQGKFSWTFLGTLVGEGAGLAAIAFAPLSAFLILVPGLGGVVGGLLGYELSSHELRAVDAPLLPAELGRSPLAVASTFRGLNLSF